MPFASLNENPAKINELFPAAPMISSSARGTKPCLAPFNASTICCPPSRSAASDRREPFLARAFSHPQGAGVIGPGAQRLLRTLLVGTLSHSAKGCNVVTTWNACSAPRPPGWPHASAPSCTSPAPPEEAIEHLESRPPRISATGRVEQIPILWLATPGPDADVVHQTLETQASNGPHPTVQRAMPLRPHPLHRHRRVITRAGLEAKDWTPREMRHSFVSLLSAGGMLLEDISSLVGHNGRPPPNSFGGGL